MAHSGFGRASPVHHSRRISKTSRRSPSRVCRRPPPRLLTGTRARHSARPVWAVVGPGGAPVCRFSTWTRFHRRNPVVVLREAVCLVAVEVDPFDAVAVAAARRYRIHHRHHRLPFAIVSWTLGCLHPSPVGQPRRDVLMRNSPRSRVEVCHRPPKCETHHAEIVSILMGILAGNFSLLLAHTEGHQTGEPL